MLRFGRVALLVSTLGIIAPFTTARADDATGAVSDATMKGLAAHSKAFEEMGKRGAFTFDFHIEQVGDKGEVSDVKEMSVRSTPIQGTDDRTDKILKYTEDGKDKTAEAQKKSDARRAEKKKAKKDKDKSLTLDLPFAPAMQPKYIFSIAERNATNPSLVRINFNPKTPEENLIKGSVWYDESKSQMTSIGFSLSKNPTFIDHVDCTVVFGLPTPLGMAPSTINFEVRGSFLFIHRKYRGTASFSDPALAF
jgi:hypothetical protein